MPPGSPRSPGDRPRRPSEVSAGGVLVRLSDRGWEVAMIRAGRYWSLPKGLVEPGETPAAAAVREVAEECGVPVEGLRLGQPLPGSDYVYRRQGRLIFKHVDHFLVEAPPETVLSPQASEIEEAEWMSFDAALARSSFRDTAAALERAREILSGSPA
ncbi:MAG TPA: NUDIX domain-containing protein [Candidatus Binatia bacterium]|nr:NUDIX domain-containing protein [Candidatus Binatia bacterium]